MINFKRWPMTEWSGVKPGIKEAKRIALREIRSGHSIREAMATAGRSTKTYDYWRGTDGDWRAQVDLYRAVKRASSDVNRGENASTFEAFRREYLDTETFVHQSRWIDIIEGRPPRTSTPP
jgi:hypothetical protein